MLASAPIERMNKRSRQMAKTKMASETIESKNKGVVLAKIGRKKMVVNPMAVGGWRLKPTAAIGMPNEISRRWISETKNCNRHADQENDSRSLAVP